jgi:hypothetical protein
MYNQHALSAVFFGKAVLGFTGFQMSLLFFYAAGFVSAGVFVVSGLDYAYFFA